MPRAKAILQNEFPYSITARCINREWFNLPMIVVWEIFCGELTKVCEKHNLLIHSFVLMSNHFHLIASTPESNISECMQRFMHASSLKLTKQGNRINGTFAGRHYKTILHDYNYYLNAYKYIYQNPIRAGLCKNAEDYEFSTLNSLVGQSEARVPLVRDAEYCSNPIGILRWLNERPQELKVEAVRYALKRQYFKPKKQNNKNKAILGANDLL